MTEPVVGVVAAYGAVGRSVVKHLCAMPRNLRLGLAGRCEERIHRIVWGELAGKGEMYVFEIGDCEALTRFSAGCRVVINCAGPSHQILDEVARASLAAGADYVDPAGDEQLIV